MAKAVALIGAVSVVINRSNGAFTMEEHAVENWQAQGRVGKTETRAREDENKRKRKREQMAWEAGEKRRAGETFAERVIRSMTWGKAHKRTPGGRENIEPPRARPTRT